MDEADQDLIYIWFFVTFFPFIVFYWILRWIIRRTKDRVWSSSERINASRGAESLPTE